MTLVTASTTDWLGADRSASIRFASTATFAWVDLCLTTALWLIASPQDASHDDTDLVDSPETSRRSISCRFGLRHTLHRWLLGPVC